MKLEELGRMADDAIARWADKTKPKPPGNPSIKVCSESPDVHLLPMLTGTVIGRNRKGLYVLLFEAKDVKRVVDYLTSEFTINE